MSGIMNGIGVQGRPVVGAGRPLAGSGIIFQYNRVMVSKRATDAPPGTTLFTMSPFGGNALGLFLEQAQAMRKSSVLLALSTSQLPSYADEMKLASDPLLPAAQIAQGLGTFLERNDRSDDMAIFLDIPENLYEGVRAALAQRFELPSSKLGLSIDHHGESYTFGGNGNNTSLYWYISQGSLHVSVSTSIDSKSIGLPRSSLGVDLIINGRSYSMQDKNWDGIPHEEWAFIQPLKDLETAKDDIKLEVRGRVHGKDNLSVEIFYSVEVDRSGKAVRHDGTVIEHSSDLHFG